MLYRFGAEPDGADPQATLVNVKGTLYGTTEYGGKIGYGTIFSVSTAGSEHALYSFRGYGDGYRPTADLIDVKGTLYGTTIAGGKYNESYGGDGTVFSVTTSGAEKVLHSFGQGKDGISPYAGLVNLNGSIYRHYGSRRQVRARRLAPRRWRDYLCADPLGTVHRGLTRRPHTYRSPMHPAPTPKTIRHIAFSTLPGFCKRGCKARGVSEPRRALRKVLILKAFFDGPRSARRRLGGRRFDPFLYAHYAAAPWQRLYFFPLPQGHSSLRPTLGDSRWIGLAGSSSSLLV